MKQKVLKTAVIIWMIVSITIAHVIVLASDIVSYAFQDVGKENVEFSSYFVTEQGEMLSSIEKPMNSEDIKLAMRIKVKEQGYLNGKIELKNENFKFKQEEIEGVEQIKDREVTLKQINSQETINFEIGLEVNVPSSVDVNQFNKDNLIVLKGTYTSANQNQREIDIEQNLPIILTSPYQEGEEASVLEAQIITNKIYKIEEQNKRIVQMQIKSGLQGNGYPIKQTDLEIEAPEGMEEATVLIRGTEATNGANELQSQKEENKLHIQIANPEKDGKINYGKQKTDTVIVTYVYEEGKEIQEEEFKVKNKVQIYDQQGTAFEKEISTKVEEEKEEIIAYTLLNQVELHKGRLYADEEQSYRSMSKIDIRYPKIEEKISIVEGNAHYNNGSAVNSVYQKTMVEKEELLQVLGEAGELVIKKPDGSEIKKITKDTVQEAENIVSIDYEEGQKEIVVEINHAENTGILNLMHEKSILPEYKSRSEIKEITELIEEGCLQETEQLEQKQVEATIQLQETQTKSEAEISNSQFIAGKTNENIEIKTTLVTNESKYDLYKNPTIEVEFPDKVQEVTIKSVSLLYGEGLAKEKEEIYQNEAGRKVAKIQLVGEQTSHADAELVKGTNIILNCDVTVDSVEENENHQIQVTCTNDQKVEYENEGKNELEVNYIVTEEMKQQDYEKAIVKANTEATQNDPITVTKAITTGNGKEIQEGQVQKYIIKVKNNTNQELTNITITDEIPSELVYTKAICKEGYQNRYEEDEKTTKFEYQIKELPEQNDETKDYMESEEYDFAFNAIEKIEPKEEVEVNYYARVKKSQENIGKKIGTKAQAKIEGNDTVYESNLVENTIKEAKLQVDMVTSLNNRYDYYSGTEIEYKIVVKNIAGQDLKGATIDCKLPEKTAYIEGCDMLYNQEKKYYYVNKTQTRKEAEYDTKTRTATWKIGNLKAEEEKVVYLKIKSETTNGDNANISAYSTAKAEGTENYKSNIEQINQVSAGECSIVKEVSLTDKYVYEGREFEYTITVKNRSKNIILATIEDEIPEGLFLKKVTYITNEEERTIEDISTVTMNYELEPEETIVIKILVEAARLPIGTEELEIKNKAKMSSLETGDKESNEVTTIIKRDPNLPEDPDNPPVNPSNPDDPNNPNNPTKQQYNISGLAWIDENRNGQKDEGESALSGITVSAYNGEGKIAKDQNGNKISVVTGDDGRYMLNNLGKGEYMVVFQYDNKNYALTEYKKAGVADENSSKVVGAQLEGKIVAATDKIQISNKNIENINIGLVPSQKFDLKLDKYISKITVENGSATKQYAYNNANFTKIEVDRKTVNNAKVTIEYQISVTNEGEIPGYARQIVDYLPEDVQINIQSQKDWVATEEGLINSTLAQEVINPGETRTVSLVVTKKLTEDNLGTVTNTAEIKQDGNDKLVGDIDSTPGNKKAGEDDMSTVSVIIGLNTGRVMLYISLFLVTIIILGVGTYIIKKKI